MSDNDPWRLRAAGHADIDDISDLSLSVFGEQDGADREVVAHSVANWRETRSPLVVARDADGHFLGYATGKPNRAGDFWRIDGQVAVLTHVAVAPEVRGSGVGSALLERAVKTMRMLGWARVMAQIPSHLVEWYGQRGWTVRPANEMLAWIEPWLPRDDFWYPELPSRAFSPLLFMAHRYDYPRLATLELGSDRPLLEVPVPLGHNDESTELMLGHAVATALLRQLSLVRTLPPALIEMIAETPGLAKSARRSLLAERSASARGAARS